MSVCSSDLDLKIKLDLLLVAYSKRGNTRKKLHLVKTFPNSVFSLSRYQLTSSLGLYVFWSAYCLWSLLQAHWHKTAKYC